MAKQLVEEINTKKDRVRWQALLLIRKLSYYLDNSWQIPGTRQRIGLDPLIGLIPGLGDILMVTLSLVIVGLAIRVGASPWTVTRMLFNVGIEALVGVIPIFGDFFDAFWKANLRNRMLLEKSLLESNRGFYDKSYLLLILFGSVVCLVLLIWFNLLLLKNLVEWLLQVFA